jgi:hypothetical protein
VIVNVWWCDVTAMVECEGRSLSTALAGWEGQVTNKNPDAHCYCTHAMARKHRIQHWFDDDNATQF